MEIILIDHYDSFSMNVLDWLERAGFNVIVCPHDSAQMQHLIALSEIQLKGNAQDYLEHQLRRPLVFGPGPRSPECFPNSLKLAERVLYRWPILGLCLGHQMIGVLAGLDVRKAAAPHHGSLREIFIDHQSPLFRGIEASLYAATYNSLVVSGNLSKPWRVCARNAQGEIEAIENLDGAGVFGIQFHPESFLSLRGDHIASNWYRYLHSLNDYRSDNSPG